MATHNLAITLHLPHLRMHRRFLHVVNPWPSDEEASRMCLDGKCGMTMPGAFAAQLPPRLRAKQPASNACLCRIDR
eukprot:294924-Pleurochrysis_carterae.AAC.1